MFLAVCICTTANLLVLLQVFANPMTNSDPYRTPSEVEAAEAEASPQRKSLPRWYWPILFLSFILSVGFFVGRAVLKYTEYITGTYISVSGRILFVPIGDVMRVFNLVFIVLVVFGIIWTVRNQSQT